MSLWADGRRHPEIPAEELLRAMAVAAAHADREGTRDGVKDRPMLVIPWSVHERSGKVQVEFLRSARPTVVGRG